VAPPTDERAGHGTTAQSGERPTGAPLRPEADDRVEDEGGQDRDRLDAFAQAPGDGRGDQQQQDDQAPELIEQEPPEWLLRMLADSVRTDPGESAARLEAGETGLGVGVEELDDLSDVQGVPLRGRRVVAALGPARRVGRAASAGVWRGRCAHRRPCGVPGQASGAPDGPGKKMKLTTPASNARS
jgi:hypothetical protein